MIEEDVRNGWRLVEIVGGTIGSSGEREYLELIFEKKI
ncbi:DUF4177 domain-containing protein [Bacillus cereus]|nr:DUF4177 domain-containing protein [Bacillus cereus]